MNDELYEVSQKMAGQGSCRGAFESAIHSDEQGGLIQVPRALL